MRSHPTGLLRQSVALLALSTLGWIATGCEAIGAKGILKAPPEVVTLDPSATFAMHRGRDGYVVDRLPGGKTGVVMPFGWSLGERPSFVLDSSGATLAAFWIPSPSKIVVHQGVTSATPSLGSIDPSWDDEAIRLRLTPSDGGALQSDVFARQGGGTGPSNLSRNAQTNLDVRGTYRAEVRDSKGAPVGWLRARMAPYQVVARLYEGALPAAVDPALGIAAALAIDAEIDWIENHVTNVYPGGNLEQSYPVGR